MEWQFCINWPALIEEAKLRRKTQRLTQARLAVMAGVSTPTISRFENGQKDIQLSTVISILTVLGLNDQRHLIFPEPNERYESDRMVVSFVGRDGDKLVPCAISREALMDHFNAENGELLKVFKVNRDVIEQEARRKYLGGSLEVGGGVLVKTEDIG